MKIYFTLILIVASITSWAQLTTNVEFRPRTEMLHGFKTPMTNQGEMFNLATTQRARLGLLYKGEKFKVGLQFQDVRAWGSEPQLVINDGFYTTMHQAWGEIIFNENLSLKIGRQELVYDDHRILGNVDWAQQARSHDLALMKYEKADGSKIHFGVAVNQVQTRPYNVVGNYKSMQFLWYNKQFKNYSLSILALNHGFDDTIANPNISQSTTTYNQIIGQHSTFKKDKWTATINLYYQLGKDKAIYINATDQNYNHKDFSAYNVRVEVGYQLNEKFNLELGYEKLSGQSQTDTSKAYQNINHSFNPAYGTNHKFNGWMDYFYVGNHLNTVGLNDLFATIKYKNNKTILGVTLHGFSTAAEVLNKPIFIATGEVEALSSNLGMELDAWYNYKLNETISIELGVSGMFDSETMRILKGGAYGASNYWVWSQIIFKPNFSK